MPQRKTAAAYKHRAQERGFRWLRPEVANVRTKMTWQCPASHHDAAWVLGRSIPVSRAGIIRFGRKGKLYEQYREGQENELNALGLVLNMVVLWTTRYMDAAINYLKGTGFDVRQEDVERLSPLVSHHINFVGEYHFTLPEEGMRGELRPFHNPDDPDNII
jgi:hypothetical protein